MNYRITTLIFFISGFVTQIHAQPALIGSCWKGNFEDAWNRKQEVEIRFHLDQLPLNPQITTPTASIHIPDFVFAQDLKSKFETDERTLLFGTNYGMANLHWIDPNHLTGFIPLKADTLTLDLKQVECPALPKPTRNKELQIDVGDLELGGTLFLPADSSQPIACAVFVHGKKCRDRTRFISRAIKLAEAGMAAFVFDKRGSPPTSSDPAKTTLEQHASDLARIIEYLSVEPGIDPYKIGLIAYSTGGWVSPLAIQKTRLPAAFFVTVVGPAISTEDYNKHWFPEMIWRKSGQNIKARNLATDYINLAYSNLPAPKRAREMNSILRIAQKKGWANFIGYEYEVRTEHDLPRLWTARHLYDPEIHLSRLKCPVLSILGEADWVMPAETNYAEFVRIFRGTDKSNYKLLKVPNANHSMKLLKPENDGSPPEIFTRMAPESWFGILDFLKEIKILEE